jgi:uncharacterized protein YerC
MTNDWLNDSDALVPAFRQGEVGRCLPIALKSELVTLSTSGVLSFKHELIAEYFAAFYLNYAYLHRQQDAHFWSRFYESETREIPGGQGMGAGLWSEPIAIWAGFPTEQPAHLAAFLLDSAATHFQFMPGQVCLEIGKLPPYQQEQEDKRNLYQARALAMSLAALRPGESLPLSTRLSLEKLVAFKDVRETLARVIKRSIDEGGFEICDLLLDLIATPGIGKLFQELQMLQGRELILKLLFEKLDTLARITGNQTQMNALIYTLGELGRPGQASAQYIFERACLESRDGQEMKVRIPAINVLKETENPITIAMLLPYLRHEDAVAEAAGSALLRLGPAHTLSHLEAEEVELRQFPNERTRQRVRLHLLDILADYTKLPNKETFLTRLVPLLIQFLRGLDDVQTRTKAHATLKELLRQEGDQQETVAKNLVLALDMEDPSQVQEICTLLVEHARESRSQAFLQKLFLFYKEAKQAARISLVQICGDIHDPSTLTFLLGLLTNAQVGNSLDQFGHSLSRALAGHRPESIEPLVLILLTSRLSGEAIEVGAAALRLVGADSLNVLAQCLFSIDQHPQISLAGLSALLSLVKIINADGNLSVGMQATVGNALVKCFSWALQRSLERRELARQTVNIMADFPQERVVRELVLFLEKGNSQLPEVVDETITSLGKLGQAASALAGRQEQARMVGAVALFDLLFSSVSHLLTQPMRSPQARSAYRIFELIDPEPLLYESVLKALMVPGDIPPDHLCQIFVDNQRKKRTVPFLAEKLCQKVGGPQVAVQLGRALGEMESRHTMAQLVVFLGEAGWEVLIPLLVKCPIPGDILPLLVQRLATDEQREASRRVLLAFQHVQGVLPWLLAGLENPGSRTYTRALLVTVAQDKRVTLTDIIRLFDVNQVRTYLADPQKTLSPQARNELRELLINELVGMSIDPLLAGLQARGTREDCVLALQTLVRLEQYEKPVVDKVLGLLESVNEIQGAQEALVSFGEIAVPRVLDQLRRLQDTSGKVTDPHVLDQVRKVQAALQTVLARMGQVAFPAIYQLVIDKVRQPEAVAILKLIPAEVMAKGLLDFFASVNFESVYMALHLLIFDLEKGKMDELARHLLRATLACTESDLHLRVLGALACYYSSSNNQPRHQRKELARHILAAATDPAASTGPGEYARALLLLGHDSVDALDTALRKPHLPLRQRQELSGILASLGVDVPVIRGYVEKLAANQYQQSGEQELGLIVFGGYLVSGNYNPGSLQAILRTLDRRNPAYEFYDVLLGQRNMQSLENLGQQVFVLQEKNRQQVQELASRKQTISDLERDLDHARDQYRRANRQFSQAQGTIHRLEEEIQRLRQNPS